MKIDLVKGELPAAKVGVFFRNLKGDYYAFNTSGKGCDLNGKVDASEADPVKETEEEMKARIRTEVLMELKKAQEEKP